MKVEVIVSTMHQTDFSLIKKMNIKTDALIINQCDEENKTKTRLDGKTIRMLSYNERGLARSRNKAIENSYGDICVIADDDLVYNDNYEELILDAYEKNPDASIIAFDVPSTNASRPTSTLKEGDIDFLHTLKISSFQITFKRKDINEQNIRFNEFFGAGARYTCGEEHIFLAEALKKGLKVKYVNSEIAQVDHNESTWFNGFDEKLFRTKGALFYQMSPRLSYLLISQYAIRKLHLYSKQTNFYYAFRYMIAGMKEYKAIKEDERDRVDGAS